MNFAPFREKRAKFWIWLRIDKNFLKGGKFENRSPTSNWLEFRAIWKNWKKNAREIWIWLKVLFDWWTNWTVWRLFWRHKSAGKLNFNRTLVDRLLDWWMNLNSLAPLLKTQKSAGNLNLNRTLLIGFLIFEWNEQFGAVFSFQVRKAREIWTYCVWWNASHASKSKRPPRRHSVAGAVSLIKSATDSFFFCAHCHICTLPSRNGRIKGSALRNEPRPHHSVTWRGASLQTRLKIGLLSHCATGPSRVLVKCPQCTTRKAFSWSRDPARLELKSKSSANFQTFCKLGAIQLETRLRSSPRPLQVKGATFKKTEFNLTILENGAKFERFELVAFGVGFLIGQLSRPPTEERAIQTFTTVIRVGNSLS